jgi:MFS family permease
MTAVAAANGMGVVWRLGTATTLMLMGFSMTGPVLAVLLQQAGHDTATIGAFAMIPFAVIALLIPVMPHLLARWGLVRAYRIGAALELLGALAYALGDGLAAWVLASLVSAAGGAALWNGTEALLAREAPADKRGRVMGLYQTSLGAALAVGPFLPGLLSLGARPVLWLAAVLIAACFAISLAVPLHASAEPPRHAQSGTWQALRAVPMLALMAFAGGVFEAGLNSVSAAYASAQGMSLGAAASVAGAIGVGSFLCQYPAGWVADHVRLHRVFGGAALLLLAASAAVAFAARAPWILWPVGLVWGGVGGALYTLCMVQVAHVFEGRGTAGGTAAIITGYTLGGMLGPLASGATLQWASTPGLAVMLGALALGALLLSGPAARTR